MIKHLIYESTAWGFSTAIYGRASQVHHFYHARLHLACNFVNLHITSGSDRAAVRGGQPMASRSMTRLATVRERAQARRLSAATGVAPVRGAQRAGAAMRERESKA
eukprot:988082-Pleurochrysis_carterae.AAC.1